jgi:hypothetical protein
MMRDENSNKLISLTPQENNLLHYAIDTEITAREERATWWRRHRHNEAMATWIMQEVDVLKAIQNRLPLLPVYGTGDSLYSGTVETTSHTGGVHDMGGETDAR